MPTDFRLPKGSTLRAVAFALLCLAILGLSLPATERFYDAMFIIGWVTMASFFYAMCRRGQAWSRRWNEQFHIWKMQHYHLLGTTAVLQFLLLFAIAARILAFFIFIGLGGLDGLALHVCILATLFLLCWRYRDVVREERDRLRKDGAFDSTPYSSGSMRGS